MPQDNRIPEGVVPPPVKPPVPGSVLSEVSPISNGVMSQRLGDIEYRAELVPELTSNPLATLGYESIREKTGGDVSRSIKHLMSNVKGPELATHGVVRGDDPEDPIFGTNIRGRHTRYLDGKKLPIIRVNTTDRIDRFGEKWIKRGEYDRLRQAQYEDGGDEVLAHELGHEALDNLFAQGKADELAQVYGEDVIRVMDYLRFADLLGDVNPRSAWRPKKTSYEREPDTAEERLNHPRVAMAILTKGHDQFDGTVELTPYERQVADLVVKVNREAAKQLTEKGVSTEYPAPLSSNSLAAINKYMGNGAEVVPEPKVERAAGGFIDRPLYDRNPYG